MTADRSPTTQLQTGRELVRRLLAGGPPHGRDFDSCRALLRNAHGGENAFTALCVLLEGALGDPGLDIGDAQTVVAVLKDLAKGRLTPEELL